jgi:hypothetical protein
MKADVVGNTTISATHALNGVEAYDLISVNLAGGGGTETVTLPGGTIRLLMVTASAYDDTDLTYDVNGGGSPVALDAPALQVGTWAALGSIASLELVNNMADDVTVNVLVGRDLP